MRYCPACRADYAPGTERCHDCEIELVDSLDEISAGEPTAVLPGNLVTIAAFDTPLKASILASKLESEDIESFIADAETIAMHGLLSAAVGGVKVQVREADAARAAAIAGLHASGQRASPACPRCGSKNTKRKGLSPLMAFLFVFTLGVIALFFAVRWRCSECDLDWR